jgi:hypothetical protein
VAVAGPSDVERDLQMLATELRRLEGEYNMFFAGRLPRPPTQTRARVESLLKRFERVHLETAALRFRLSTLQARYSSFAELWDRGLRAREEGRPGPFLRRPGQGSAKAAGEHVVHVASFTDPTSETEKLERLYEALMDARRQAGEPVVPFHRFAELVRTNVAKLRETDASEVAFRVVVSNGKVNLTATAGRSVKR